MASNLKNVAIIGVPVAALAKIILNGLVASSQLEITIISRKESDTNFPPSVTIFKTDYLDEGVKRFIPSEFSANTQNYAVLQLLPLFGRKELVEYFENKETNVLTRTGIAASGLFDRGLANGFLGFDIASHTATIRDGAIRVSFLPCKKALYEAVAPVLIHPDEPEASFYSLPRLKSLIRTSLLLWGTESGVK
ncbi:hypothetical protein PDIDSM_1439 [Penicillium digitatum]|nr:hypothetical protein PDIDSM_1439 [Penicillium digitatum]